MTSNSLPQHLTIGQLAERLGMTKSQVYELNKRSQGPPRIKIGHRTVRYRVADVEAWEQRHIIGDEPA